jgi:gamma-glutamyltranspeptidase/glutathione hydrolase
MPPRGLNAGIPFAEGRGGVVAAKHVLAAEAGLEMLHQGGNAVDAACATAFATGVVEPWMSGLGGIGYMVIQPASGEPPVVVDYGPVAPRAAREDTFEIVAGAATGPFPWAPVKDDANHQGWRSVAVPGMARGVGLALARFGRLGLPTVLAPAIRLARDGFPVSWNATLRIAIDASIIARYPETARTFLPEGLPPSPPVSDELPAQRIVQTDLANTLSRLAEHGVDDLYTGETARRIVAAMQAHGGLLDTQDLASYQARVSPALTLAYKGWQVGTPGGATGGTTLARMLELFAASPASAAPFGTLSYLDGLLRSFSDAFAARYVDLAGETAAPLPEPIGTSTTHLTAADADGLVVSCTQTLLAAFGSRVTVPGTRILLNDGMYWIDPRPGQANSIGPSKRPLNNMTPLVAVGPGGWPRLGLGSSGGRRIVSANAQMLLATIDGVDASGDQVLADLRLDPALLDALRDRGWDVLAVEESPYPRHFASPTGVAAYADGRRAAAADPFMPAAALALG